MIETTVTKTIANLPEMVRQCSRRNETFLIYENDGEISQPVNGIPQPASAEPVAVVISWQRLKWLESRTAS